ncbi:MAG: helix-hairpin-helix domain-containing protein [Clostridia bacterium]|nr:helix-hairpin-helix domain-containing protein [Clostridia bacterium]
MKSERKQITFIGIVALICIIIIIGYNYYSAKSVNIYNVDSTVYIVPHTYVPEEQRININTADAEELMKLEGVGETLANRIVEYRSANGQFSSIYELCNVDGISENKVEKLSPYIKTE